MHTTIDLLGKQPDTVYTLFFDVANIDYITKKVNTDVQVILARYPKDLPYLPMDKQLVISRMTAIYNRDRLNATSIVEVDKTRVTRLTLVTVRSITDDITVYIETRIRASVLAKNLATGSLADPVHDNVKTTKVTDARPHLL